MFIRFVAVFYGPITALNINGFNFVLLLSVGAPGAGAVQDGSEQGEDRNHHHARREHGLGSPCTHSGTEPTPPYNLQYPFEARRVFVKLR